VLGNSPGVWAFRFGIMGHQEHTPWLLSEEGGESFDANFAKVEASERIDELQAKTGPRPNTSGASIV